ncbi:hypothetical protein TNCV_479521 [Trichonephila clavipes]|nr:hypothetical protein TNCV_479521 [Trichonephila clavipes]
MSCEVQLQGTLLSYAQTVEEDSMPETKLVPTENGRGVRYFHLTLYKRSDDSHFVALVLDSGLSDTLFKGLSSRLGLPSALH